MATKNILITGVSGFIGKNLVKYFEPSDNVRVIGHSRNPEAARATIKNERVTVIDDYLSGQLDTHRIDTIIHLAGIAHDLDGTYQSDDYFKVNDEDTRTLYNAFLKSGASRFIFLSSIKAAVDTTSIPATENVECHPLTPYGQSKRNAELHILQQSLPPGKSFYILRPGMVHGPGNKGNLNLLYKFVKSGLPWPLAAFSNKRSFLSIGNLNYIIGHILEHPTPSGIYHLADEGSISTNELFKLIGEVMGKRSALITIPQGLVRLVASLTGKKHMVAKVTEDLVVSNEKIVRAIGQPLPVKLRDGIAQTIRSFQ